MVPYRKTHWRRRPICLTLSPAHAAKRWITPIHLWFHVEFCLCVLLVQHSKAKLFISAYMLLCCVSFVLSVCCDTSRQLFTSNMQQAKHHKHKLVINDDRPQHLRAATCVAYEWSERCDSKISAALECRSHVQRSPSSLSRWLLRPLPWSLSSYHEILVILPCWQRV